MSAELRIDGLEELERAIRRLPEDLADDAQAIIDRHATTAAARIRAGYPRVTGNLADGVEAISGRIGGRGRTFAGALVSSSAPHVHIYEYGTAPRRTKQGWNRGVMPANPTFVPIMIEERRMVYIEIAAMMETHGLWVTGVAA